MILVDTSAWIGIILEHDQAHDQAKEIFEHLLSISEPLVVTDYILAESYTLLRKRSKNPQRIRFFDEIIREAISTKLLSIHWTNETIFDEARNLFFEYADQRFSFTDCVSFIAGRKLKVKRVFSFDQDFVVMKFEVLPDSRL